MARSTVAGILLKYFGRHPEQTLPQFSAELKALSAEEKLELARGAARALKLSQDDVEFTL